MSSVPSKRTRGRPSPSGLSFQSGRTPPPAFVRWFPFPDMSAQVPIASPSVGMPRPWSASTQTSAPAIGPQVVGGVGGGVDPPDGGGVDPPPPGVGGFWPTTVPPPARGPPVVPPSEPELWETTDEIVLVLVPTTTLGTSGASLPQLTRMKRGVSGAASRAEVSRNDPPRLMAS